MAVKEEYLDKAVSEALIERLSKPDFLAMLGQRGEGADAERAEIVTILNDRSVAEAAEELLSVLRALGRHRS